MLIIVDDYSRFAWTLFLGSKNGKEVSKVLDRFFTSLKTQYNVIPRGWRTDQGRGEFSNELVQEIIANMGSKHEFSPAKTPQLNGTAERIAEIIKSMARAMFYSSGLGTELSLMAEAIAASTHVYNRCPASANEVYGYPEGDIRTTPYHMFHNEIPSMGHLRPWGCLAYIHIKKEERKGNSWEPHAKPALLMGYVHETDKLWKLIDLTTGSMTTRSDVTFDEEVFPGPAWRRAPPAEPRTDISMLQNKSPAVPDLVRKTANWQVYGPAQSTPVPPAPIAHTSDGAVASPQGTEDAEADRRGGVFHITCADAANLTTEAAADIDDGVVDLSPTTDLASRSFRTAAGQKTSPAPKKRMPRVDHNGDPLTIKDARLSDDWLQWEQAIKDEWARQLETGTLLPILLPPGRTAISCKWVFKRKYEANGSVRHKARLVARGFEQEAGIDFQETFAPTGYLTTLRMLISLSNHFGWDLRLLDVVTAFLNGDIDVEMYMDYPPAVPSQSGKVLKLCKALYGLKQSPRLWWQRLFRDLKTMGFIQCEADTNLFVRRSQKGILFLLVYVDDLLLAGTPEELGPVTRGLMRLYKMRDLGFPSQFLGIQIERINCKIILHQEAYVKRMLARFDMDGDDIHPTNTPLHARTILKSAADDELLDDEEAATFRSAVGALGYAVICTRPDLAFTYSRLSKFSSKPGRTHWQAMKSTLRYLAGTTDLGLVYKWSGDDILFGYSDSDFASDPENRRSTSGFIFYLGGSLISWKAKQQTIVTRSTHDAEYIGLANASYEISWIRRVITFCLPASYVPLPPTTLYGDNQGSIASAGSTTDSKMTPRSRHIDIRYHIIRDAVADGTIRLQYIPTAEMTADVLTKPLPKESYWKHVESMGMRRLRDVRST